MVNLMNIAEAHLHTLIFIVTIFLTYILILSKPFHIKFSQDLIGGPQKIHDLQIPRIGGVSIFIIMFLVSIMLDKGEFLFYLVVSAIPIFISGLLEDLTKKISASIRLICTFISAILCVFLIKHGINSLGFEIIDKLIADTYLKYLFAFFSIILLTQSYNIIDGLNGFCLLNAILVTLSIIYVSNHLGSLYFFHLGCLILSVLLGIFFFNFPKPLIFLGDGGAYFLGFILSTVLIIFSEENIISPLFCLAIVIYPIYETFRSFFRRLFTSNSSFMKPDALHLHSLIYRYINSKNYFKEIWIKNSIASILSVFLPMLLSIWSCINFNNRNFLIFGIILFLFIFECLIYYLKKYNYEN